MEDDQKFEDMKKRLQPFPNYFQLELQTVSCKTWKQVKQKLEEEEEAHVCQSDMEIRMDKNLKACVYYELGDPEKAGELLVEVLNSSGNKNINASAMMALIHYKNGMFTESNNIMGQLEALKDSGDTFLIDEACAEMAYGYSRIDARYYTKAIKLFEYVIKRQPVQHEQFVFTWKFGLALTLRRCIRFDLRTLHPNINLKETDERADELLVDIIKNCTNDVYIAMACVERADLCSHDVDPSTNIDKLLVERLIEQGVNKAPNDHVILAKAGKLLRRIFHLRKAEKYLRKPVNIRETPLGLHQLGLLLKGKLKKRQKGKHIKRGARVRGTGHTPRHTQEAISDCRSMPRKREGFTIGNEYDKGSSKPVLGNSSNNPIPESKSILSTVYKDRKLNSQPIMKIGPELAGVTLESKKAKDTISRDQLLNNTLDCTRPTNMARKSIDVPLTVDKTQPDGTRLTAVVGGEYRTTLKTKCVFNTKCDTEKASDMTDTFDSLVVKVPGIVRSSSLSPYAKPFVPSRKQPVACDTQIPPTTEYGSSMELYGSPMGLFSRILKYPAHNRVAIYNETNTHQLENASQCFKNLMILAKASTAAPHTISA
ncbi:hypothetical protein SNE40_015417 [Patella caerulea]|uniref:Uncharacterized protein n=1 Tax=Patella caerulea TaxID=87958 RepID=A0AAN8JL37_PATCE